jgi:hypothetical protein
MSHPDVCIFAAEEAEAKVTEQTFDKDFFYPLLLLLLLFWTAALAERSGL